MSTACLTLMDLCNCVRAAHRTNVDGVWIRPNAPRQLALGATVRFGASTREYKVRLLGAGLAGRACTAWECKLHQASCVTRRVPVPGCHWFPSASSADEPMFVFVLQPTHKSARADWMFGRSPVPAQQMGSCLSLCCSSHTTCFTSLRSLP